MGARQWGVGGGDEGMTTRGNGGGGEGGAGDSALANCALNCTDARHTKVFLSR